MHEGRLCIAENIMRATRTVVALVLVLRRHGVPVVSLGLLRLAVVALVLVLRLGVVLRRLRVPVVALGVVLGLACGGRKECQTALGQYNTDRKLIAFSWSQLSSDWENSRAYIDNSRGKNACLNAP